MLSDGAGRVHLQGFDRIKAFGFCEYLTTIVYAGRTHLHDRAARTLMAIQRAAVVSSENPGSIDSHYRLFMSESQTFSRTTIVFVVGSSITSEAS